MADNLGGALFGNLGVQASLFEDYQMGFRNNMKKVESDWIKMWQSKTPEKKVAGKYSVFALEFGLSGGAGAIGDDDNYNGTRTGDVDTQQVLIKNLSSSGAMGIKTIYAGVSPQGAFEDLFEKEMKRTMIAAKDMEHNEVFTKELGTIDTVRTLNAAADFTSPQSVAVESTNRFQVGQILAIHNSDGTVLRAKGLIVKSTSRPNRTITLLETGEAGETGQNAVALAVGDIITYRNAKGKGLTGIEDAFETGNTYHGIDRTDREWYEAQITDAAGDPLDEDYLRDATDDVDIEGSEHMIDGYVVEHGVLKLYESGLQGSKRYNNSVTDGVVGAPNLAGGHTYLTFDNKPIYKDRRTTLRTAYGLSSDCWIREVHTDWRYDDFHGSPIKFQSKQVINWDMIKYCNYSTDAPRKNFAIKDLQNVRT